MESKTLPDDYLEACSLDALESLMLARMNLATNLLGEVRNVLELWVQAEMDARLASWMLETRRSQALRAGGAARLLPEKTLLGRPQRALPGPAAAADAEPIARLVARSVPSAAALPAAPVARIASRRSHRDAFALPVAGKLVCQRTHGHVQSRALALPAAATANVQLSPGFDSGRTPEPGADSTARQDPDAARVDQLELATRGTELELREVLDLLPSNSALATVRAISAAAAQHHAAGPRECRAAKPSPARVGLASSTRLRAAVASPTSPRDATLVRGYRRVLPAS